MTALTDLLSSYREAARSNRESGTYFEELIACYLRTEPRYRDLYRQVWMYSDWARQVGRDGRDVGVDLVAETVTGEVHAIQCKLYEADHRINKADIDSFFTASGQKPFVHRVIVSTTNNWGEHAENALREQQPPVTKIDLSALEDSVIDWSRFAVDVSPSPPALKPKKVARPHQRDALTAVIRGLAREDRGKLIMACGSGKTFTSLKIAEALAGPGSRVLFLVPSLALLSQTLTEWTQESETPLHSFAVCSDSDVGKRRKKNDDIVQTFIHELHYPATTNAERLAAQMAKRHDGDHMSVVYATYHSIDVIHRAQHEHRLPDFDLVICDEAHRTTGAKFAGEDESHFIRVHDPEYLRAAKRLYMTATPRIYGDSAKATAEREDVTLCSMDDEQLYGPHLYILTFSEAVKRDLLVDYKVIVLAVEESHVSRRLQGLLADDDNQLRVYDAAKIVGCWKALAKIGLAEGLSGDPDPMRRAVAFCQVIEAKPTAKSYKVGSKNIAEMFQAVVEAYQETTDEGVLRCEAEHVDGSMNASRKREKLSWLEAEAGVGTCRILSNVRCLSEGVDVPALDAVLFLSPRNSQVDVVQSVGRVMRKAPGKARGYVVLPVVIPAGVEPNEALNDNRTYRVVWQVLQALRSHDDRFDAMVNKLDLSGHDPTKMEVIAITDKVSKRKPRSGKSVADTAKRRRTIGARVAPGHAGDQREIEFEIGEIERAIYAKLVHKVGNRHHWEDWAKDIARIAATHVDRIHGILENPDNVAERETFAHFAKELRDDLNDGITEDEIVEMLAQHLVTRPVFDALFAERGFVTQNPISVAMQTVLDALTEHRLDKEAATLTAFYDSVKLRAEGIDSAEGKQRIVVELYEKFFRNAFPQMSDRLGIVYTPVEIVDFILHSVDHILREEFGQNIASEGVHIIDPFTGTGTFVTRLLHSGLIDADALPRKFKHEIHANELVLLAYYIAAVNIEAAYHGLVGGDYEPFEGICLTDTFQLYEKEDLVAALLEDNSVRRKRQKHLDIRVVIGNPPYSIGQASQNDNNQNVAYPSLDARIAETYATRSSASLSRGLYDSYIRAIRWASDRIGDDGVIGFVTNASFVEVASADGMRRCLADEFSSLYIFHLRGNQRTSGELSKREGGKVFGSGSRAPVAISILVKNSRVEQRGQIFFHDIGDYLTREQKLAAVERLGGIDGIAHQDGWVRIVPDEHGDWLRQRKGSFADHIPAGIKGRTRSDLRVFDTISLGVVTNRDPWACGFSSKAVRHNIGRMIDFYNAEAKRFDAATQGLDTKARTARVDELIETDPTRISWTVNLKRELVRGTRLSIRDSALVPTLYRPFTKHWLYFDRQLNERVLQVPRLFPGRGATNRVIGVSASESRGGYSVLMTDLVPSLHCVDMVGSQFFPLFVYESSESEPAPRDGITDEGLAHFRAAYPKQTITKQDLFYYVYGILHSPEYRECYAENLGKELPRIPRVRRAEDFWAFCRAGRELGDLHVGYEDADPYPARLDGAPATLEPAKLRVRKMKFGATKADIQYNEFITVREIPLEAYEYTVNGKPAIQWVMEQQAIKKDKASGITKDPNDWAIETADAPRYPLLLLLRVINVSLETLRIVRGLPALDILQGS